MTWVLSELLLWFYATVSGALLMALLTSNHVLRSKAKDQEERISHLMTQVGRLASHVELLQDRLAKDEIQLAASTEKRITPSTVMTSHDPSAVAPQTLK